MIGKKNVMYRVVNNVTICEIRPECENSVAERAFDFCCSNSLVFRALAVRDRDLMSKLTRLKIHNTVGRATCSAEDTFDRELGEMIAYRRLENKVIAKFYKAVNKAMAYVDREMSNTYDRGLTLGTKLEKSDEYKVKKIKEKLG